MRKEARNFKPLIWENKPRTYTILYFILLQVWQSVGNPELEETGGDSELDEQHGEAPLHRRRGGARRVHAADAPSGRRERRSR